MTVKDIISMIESAAPKKLACSWDNVGLICGRENAEVKTVLVSLDIDMEVALEAKNAGAEMIVTHHPLIFDPIKQVNESTAEGRVLLYLIENKISLYSAHTNLDAACGGTNDYLATLYELENVTPFEITYEENGEKFGLGRTGSLKKPQTLKEFAQFIGKKLGIKNVSYIGDDDKIIRTAALVSGGGGGMVSEDIDADVYITGDVKYSNARNAHDMGLAVIIADHYSTEVYSKNIFDGLIKGVTVIKSNAKNIVKEILVNG